MKGKFIIGSNRQQIWVIHEYDGRERDIVILERKKFMRKGWDEFDYDFRTYRLTLAGNYLELWEEVIGIGEEKSIQFLRKQSR